MSKKQMTSFVLASCLVALASASGCYQSYPGGFQSYNQESFIAPSCGGNAPVLEVPAIQRVPTYNAAPTYSAYPVRQPIYNFPTIPSAPLVAQAPVYSQPIAVGSNAGGYLQGSIDCGPQPTLNSIKYLKPVVLPEFNEKIRELPTPPLPPPTVISNKCSCTKVVQKPQLYQRIIQSQKNQRFLKKTFVPRVEKVEYSAKPRC